MYLNGHWQMFVADKKTTPHAHWQYVSEILTDGLEQGSQKPFWKSMCI